MIVSGRHGVQSMSTKRVRTDRAAFDAELLKSWEDSQSNSA
jgi:hypothetical protein